MLKYKARMFFFITPLMIHGKKNVFKYIMLMLYNLNIIFDF